MAIIDMKNVLVYLTDGTQATHAFTSASGANGLLTFKDASKHRGLRTAPSVTIVNPGTASHALTFAVAANGFDVTITLATDGGSAITTTAALLVAGLVADAASSAVVTCVAGGSGAGLIDAQAKTQLTTGPTKSLTVLMGDGTLTFDEKVQRRYISERGLLGVVVDGDDEPMDVKLDTEYQFVTGDSGGGPTMTPEDALLGINVASTWVTTGADPCEPYAIDVSFQNTPTCNGVLTEWTMLPEFRWESMDHDPRTGKIIVAGKCNAKQALSYRQ